MDNIKPDFVVQVVELVDWAATKAMEIYESDDHGVEYKEDDSPVGRADKAVNDILCSDLPKIFDAPIMSEENDKVPYEDRKKWTFWWCIDPIDGTKEFIEKNGDFGINVALMLHDRPIFGLIFYPVTCTYCYATLGGGAFKWNGSELIELHCRNVEVGEKLKVIVSRTGYSKSDKLKEKLNALDDHELIIHGGPIKFLAMSEGEAHLYPRASGSWEWDTAPGQIIVEEAGGRVVEWGNQEKKLTYNKENLENPHFIVHSE